MLPRNHGKHPGGRPPKYTPELVAKLANALASGLTDQQAADLVGINVTTLQRWCKKDDEFCRAIKKARAQRLLLRLTLIEAGVRGWQAIAWTLERAHGRQFARPRPVARPADDSLGSADERNAKEASQLLRLL